MRLANKRIKISETHAATIINEALNYLKVFEKEMRILVFMINGIEKVEIFYDGLKILQNLIRKIFLEAKS